MKVFINAASVKEGGSKVVLLNLLDAMRRQRPDVQWVVAAPAQLTPELARRRVVVVETRLDGGLLSFLRWYGLELPRAVKRSGSDILFSQTNNLPLAGLRRPTVLLEQHAGHFSETFARLTCARAGAAGRLAWWFKTFWVKASVKGATSLTVQTAALADAIARETGRPRAGIQVIPHGPGLVASERRGPRAAGKGPFRIGYVAKWGVQKDFGVLFEAVRRLSADHDIRLVLTLDPSLPEVREALFLGQRLGIAGLVENRGDLRPDEISRLYDELDAFAFPSFCESFGFPMVEAMARGLPLVVAATPENLEVAEGAPAFPPGDAQALAERLEPLITNPAARRAASQASLARSRAFSWDEAARQTLALLESTLKAHDPSLAPVDRRGRPPGADRRALRGSPV
jgi:glycosyltransferase involved in cell wall biosynthesis